MQVVERTENFIIIDDFLPQDAWAQLLDQLECEIYKPVELGQDKVYKLNSGLIYKSLNKYWFSKLPWQNNYTPFGEHLQALLREDISFIPKYEDLSMMVHCYQAGSEIGWHRDSGVLAAYTFYCHQDWHPMWGGNLMIASEKTSWDRVRLNTDPLPGTHLKDSFGELYQTKGVTFDHSIEKQVLQSPGLGSFVMPKPNRLVLISNKVFHKVERVDAAAGSHSRVSLTGFFTDSSPKG
ncbi:MAG: 2OG-Fe(II) oxygenase [Bdellovibrionales bacterium]|nr:2OG-Fe(II) oxygenase [Bdellovibrionales bacterium]